MIKKEILLKLLLITATNVSTTATVSMEWSEAEEAVIKEIKTTAKNVNNQIKKLSGALANTLDLISIKGCLALASIGIFFYAWKNIADSEKECGNDGELSFVQRNRFSLCSMIGASVVLTGSVYFMKKAP
jgi:hypothetical protein